MNRNKTADSPRRDRALVTAAEWFAGGRRVWYDPESARVLTENEAAAAPGALRVFERVAAAAHDAFLHDAAGFAAETYLAFLAGQLFGGQDADDGLFEVAVVHHTQCGTSLLADPGFRHQAAQATGLPEAALAASAVADPHITVKADVERLLTAPSLSPKVSVSGHVYDIATGRLTTTVDARYP